MTKILVGLIAFFSVVGVTAQTIQRRRVVVNCGESDDWQTLSPLKWRRIKEAEQNAVATAHTAKTFLIKLNSFEIKLEEWHKNILNVNSYPNPNNIDDEKEKRELLQKIKNDPNAIINRAKQGYKLLDDLALMRKIGSSFREKVQRYMSYLERNLGDKVQAFNKYNSTQATSSQKDSARKIMVSDFDYKDAIGSIRIILQELQ